MGVPISFLRCGNMLRMQNSVVSRLTLFRPRNLAGLMDIYEGNYRRLLRLAPELEQMSGTVVSRVSGALDLYMTVLERSKYTTTLSLTYLFNEKGSFIAEPDSRVRVYHDARVVEVLTHRRRKRPHHSHRHRARPRQELEHRWESNRFLQKWLGFCQRQGHLFLHCTAVQVQSPLQAQSSSTP